MHTYVYTAYIYTHPINDEAFPTAPSRIRTRTRTRLHNATADAAASAFPTVGNHQRVHLVASRVSYLTYSTFSMCSVFGLAVCVASLAVELFTSQAKNQDRKPSVQ